MADPILRINVGNGTGGFKSALKKIFRFSSDNEYRFRVLQSPVKADATEWSAPCSLEVSKSLLELLRQNLHSENNLEQIGKALAKAIFSTEIYTIYQNSFNFISENQKLRLLLSFDKEINHLATSVPWECIFHYVRAELEYFGLSQRLSIARFIPKPDTKPLKILDRLRVMAVAPNPHRCAQALDVAKELAAMGRIADKRPDAINFLPCPNAQWEDFKIQFPEFQPHVLIYTGHSKFIKKRPHLLFQTETGDCDPILISTFARELEPLNYNLRLVILSACETAVASDNHPFSSAATELIDAGIPIVIAMQSQVEENAAREFGLRFFTYLLQRYSIDTCVNAGRLAMLEAERDSSKREGTQWPIPVLYLSTRTEAIFDFGATSNVNPELEKKREIKKVKFPHRVKPFIERPSISGQLQNDYANLGVTVVYGQFGAGKTQLVSTFCISLIESSDQTDDEPLFFYVKCSEEWSKFDSVLTDLDRQGKTLGFYRFGSVIGQSHSGILAELEHAQVGGLKAVTKILGQLHPEDDLDSIRRFIDLLAENRLVIVFDDYIWDGADFWHDLFNNLAVYLRNSKVYILTTSKQFAGRDGEYSTIIVPGFLPAEAGAFFNVEQRFDRETLDNMMAVAASVDYLPWYMKIIRDLFKGEHIASTEASIGTWADEFIIEIDRRMNENRRAILKQLSVLRRTMTLRNLATMLNPNDPSEYLEEAYGLQGESLLAFTRNLGVELPSNLRRYYLETMTDEELTEYHSRAAEFYDGQSGHLIKDKI